MTSSFSSDTAALLPTTAGPAAPPPSIESTDPLSPSTPWRSLRSVRPRTCVVMAGAVAILLGITIGMAVGLRPRSNKSGPPPTPTKTPTTTVLFVWRDAGETLALKPVLQSLLAKGVAAKALVWGAAALLVSDLPADAILTWPAAAKAPGKDREAKVAQRYIDDLVAQHADIKCAVTGLISAVQLQVAQGFRRRQDQGQGQGGTTTPRVVLGYADSFSLWNSSGTWPNRFVAPPPASLDGLMVTAALIAGGARKQNPDLDVAAVGSPTLESWQAQTSDRAELEALRKALFPASSTDTPLVTYMGGYGAGYRESVTIFAEGIAALQRQQQQQQQQRQGTKKNGETTVSPPPLALFAPHPGHFSSAMETAIFKQAGAAVLVLPGGADPGGKPGSGGGGAPPVMPGVGVPSSKLAAISNLTVSQGSTTGIQSLFIGKSAWYVCGDKGETRDFLPARLGLIPTLTNASAMLREFNALRDRPGGFAFDVARLGDSGVPRGAAALIEERVRRVIG